MNSLDLYAKIEKLLGIDEAAYYLYTIFLDEIEELKFSGKNALDFGCGNGKFAKILSDDFKVLGLDLSPKMVQTAKANGINAMNLKLSEIDEKFDLITAVSDVINYMDDEALKEFFSDAYSHLNEGGYLIFDINTKRGFSDIANGVLHQKDGENHLIIDANFEEGILKTQMIYFAKDGEKFTKIENSITQYYHEFEKIKEISPLKFVKKREINLYSDEFSDKILLIFRR